MYVKKLFVGLKRQKMCRVSARSLSIYNFVWRLLIYHASNTKPQQFRRFAVDRLKDRDVASRYYDELVSKLQGVQPQPLSLDEKCEKLKEAIQTKFTIHKTLR
jgi:hypothetical protein